MPKHDDWYETMRALEYELDLALTNLRYDTREEIPLLWNATDCETDQNAVYGGLVLTLEDGRKVRLSLEPVE